MTNLAYWDGKRFILGTTCYCNKCDCDCNYDQDYSGECEVTHWMPLELPEFEMERYFDDRMSDERIEAIPDTSGEGVLDRT